jgi:GNAT superfamily N-acetyltransferase
VNIIDSDRYTSYAVLANDLPVAWLYLTRKAGWAAWEVLQVFVFPELRGHGLASKIYKAAVNHDGILLASGKTQSKSSRKLWKQLIETNAFHVWAQDFKNLDLRAGVEYYDDELYCELPVYTRDATKHDVRFVAHRR